MTANKTELEELRYVVEKISDSVDQIYETGISDQALLLLIQAAAPGKIPMKQIEAVLGGMSALASFVFPPEEGM